MGLVRVEKSLFRLMEPESLLQIIIVLKRREIGLCLTMYKEFLFMVGLLMAGELLCGLAKLRDITHVRIVQLELYHIVVDGCQGVTVQGVKVSAPSNSPNTDGIHVQTSTGVTITGIGIKTGDDCISIGLGMTNLWIEHVNCGPGHGISIGSLGKKYQEKGVQNVTVKTTMFTGTENVLRIKTWGRPSTRFVKAIVFEQALMQNVENPIIIDQNYCPDDRGCPDQFWCTNQ